jgi:hypothetical protein
LAAESAPSGYMSIYALAAIDGGLLLLRFQLLLDRLCRDLNPTPSQRQ